MSKVLAVRLDNDGDVLLTGPAVRSLRGSADAVDLLVSTSGAQAAALLPAVNEVLIFDAPWSGFCPPPVNPVAIAALIRELSDRAYDRAVVFTSFHQSPLPMALLARLAEVPCVAAASEDYPGSLLDLRHVRRPVHEVEAALDLAAAAGGRLPDGDDGSMRLRRILPAPPEQVPAEPYVVVHPAASVPARSLTPTHAATIVRALTADGWPVVLTGTVKDRAAFASAATDGGVRNLMGRTDYPTLATVLAGAAVVVATNTGPAHLAAAVKTPVVSLFAPVVPAESWAPYGVPSIVLGDQQAPCRDTRARMCPVPGHPCLSGIPGSEVVTAVHRLLRATGTEHANRRDLRPVVNGGGR
jgi:heptosyltransferase-3